MSKHQKIYVAGHRGMVGSAIVRKLLASGVDRKMIVSASHAELDLTRQEDVEQFFTAHKPDQVYLAAARVGGIHANDTYPADFIYKNLMIEANVIHEAWRQGIKKLLFLGSSCIYPKFSPQPISEKMLLDGKLEPTNEPYALAKIAGIKLCESYNRQYETDFRSVMPTNLYGPGDNYHPENSHVIPALVRRFHEAKVHNLPSVTVWGSGNPKREFLHVDDLAAACVHIMNIDMERYVSLTSPMLSHINIGSGKDLKIRELAESIAEVIGYSGDIVFDSSKPDGTPRKLLDCTIARQLGWEPLISLYEGLSHTYNDFLSSIKR